MEKMSIELTKSQRENLILFLQRVQLTGAEVPAYLEIVKALNEPFLKDADNHKKHTQS